MLIHTGDTVHNNKGSISNTESSCHLRGEVNVSGRVNQVDQETLLTLLALVRVGNEHQVFLLELEEHRDSTGEQGS